MLRTMIAAALVGATPAVAGQAMNVQTPVYCDTREAILATLQRRYGEAQQSYGYSPDWRSVVEIWSNADTGTWTLLVSGANGRSCVIGSGDAWGAVDAEPAGDPT